MAVRYIYPNENEVIIHEATNFDFIYDVIPETVTRWQAMGTYYDKVDKRTNIWFSSFMDSPNSDITFEEIFRNSYDPVIDADTGENLGTTVTRY